MPQPTPVIPTLLCNRVPPGSLTLLWCTASPSVGLSLQWVMNIGSDWGSQCGGGAMCLRDPPTWPSLWARDTSNSVTSSGLCPSAPSPLSLLLTVFCVRQWLSQALPLLKGLSWGLCLRVTFTEISCEINVFQHCLTLFQLYKLGYGVTMRFSLMCPVGHTITSALWVNWLLPPVFLDFLAWG